MQCFHNLFTKHLPGNLCEQSTMGGNMEDCMTKAQWLPFVQCFLTAWSTASLSSDFLSYAVCLACPKDNGQ